MTSKEQLLLQQALNSAKARSEKLAKKLSETKKEIAELNAKLKDFAKNKEKTHYDLVLLMIDKFGFTRNCLGLNRKQEIISQRDILVSLLFEIKLTHSQIASAVNLSRSTIYHYKIKVRSNEYAEYQRIFYNDNEISSLMQQLDGYHFYMYQSNRNFANARIIR